MRFSLLQSKYILSNASSSLYICSFNKERDTNYYWVHTILIVSNILWINWWNNSLFPSSLKLLYPPENLEAPGPGIGVIGIGVIVFEVSL